MLAFFDWYIYFVRLWFFWFYKSPHPVKFLSFLLRAGSGTVLLVTGWEKKCSPLMEPESSARTKEPHLLLSLTGKYCTDGEAILPCTD